MFKKSQTSTEYLVITAVVIVIALLVVGILGGIPSIGGGASENQARLLLSVQKVGITDFAILEGGLLRARVQNNHPSAISLDELVVNGESCIVPGSPVTLRPGQQQTLHFGCFDIAKENRERFSHPLSFTWTDVQTRASFTVSNDDLKLVGRVARSSCINYQYGVSAGFSHTCGIQADGSSYCWGLASNGQLGNGATSPNQLTPDEVLGNHKFASITAGSQHTCGVTVSGDAYCWGFAGSGRLGNGATSPNQPSPVPVNGNHKFSSISAGNSHTCGVTVSGDAYCWGNAGDGKLGNPSASNPQTTPIIVLGNLKFSSISAGNSHTCGVTVSGEVYCWGFAGHGRLGNPSASNPQTTPIIVLGNHKFASISAGSGHTCGVTVSGDAYCWGSAGSGRLGNGATSPDQLTPVPVNGNHKFASISAGDSHTCGTTTSGAVYCWGSGNNGRLGEGSTTSRSTPRAISTPTNTFDVTTGYGWC